MFVEKLLVEKPAALVRAVVLGMKSLPVELPGKRITSLPIRFNVIPRNDFPVTPLSEIETALASVTDDELTFAFIVKFMLPPELFCVEKYPFIAIVSPLPHAFGGTVTVITAVSVVVSAQLATDAANRVITASGVPFTASGVPYAFIALMGNSRNVWQQMTDSGVPRWQPLR